MKAKSGSLADFAAKESATEELRLALRSTQQKLAKAQAKKEELVAAVHSAAKDAALTYPHPPPIARPKKGKPGDHWALLHLTDWQLGKKTESYNSDIAEQRVLKAVERAIMLTEFQRESHPVSSCALLLGGDMVEGVSIFPNQAWQVDSGLFDQMFRVSALIERVVVSLLAQFDHVEVWEEYGNHGRIGKPGDVPAEDNVDRMAYRVAKERVGTRPGLVWHESKNWYNHGKIGNYSFLLVHGDENRRMGAGSANGILNQVKAYAAGVVEPFKDCYQGHWHRYECLSLPNGGAIYLTGSPESGNEYARQHLGATGQPLQRLHFIDPKNGRVVSEHRLWL